MRGIVVAGSLLLFGGTVALPLALDGPKPFAGTTLTSRGACKVTISSADCWDMTGMPDSKLTDQINLLLQGQEFNLRFGKPNVFAAIERTGSYVVLKQQNADFTPYLPMNYGISGRNSMTLIQLFPSPGKERVTVEAFASAPDWALAKTIPLISSTGTPSPSQFSVSSYVSHRIDFDDEFREPYLPRSIPLSRGGHGFYLELKQDFSPDLSVQQVAIQSKDRSGNVIKYVDGAGKPVDVFTYLTSQNDTDESQSTRSGVTNQAYVPALFLPISDSKTGFIRFETNVSPNSVGELQVVNEAIGVPIGDFPTQPNRPS